MERDQVRLVLLAMHSHEENLVAIEQLRLEGFNGYIAATARFDDEIAPLKERGADYVYHISRDAGPALASGAMERAGVV